MEAISVVKEEEIQLSDISLRPLDLSDIDDMMVWATDDKVSHFCSWYTYTSRDDVINYIQTMVIPHPWHRAICLKNRAIGAISVSKNYGDDGKNRGELGYVLATKYWGKGIVTHAVKMAVVAVFQDRPNLERVEALVDVENGGSQRVLEKAGFRREGVLRKYIVLKGRSRDMVIFSLLSTDLMA